MSQAPRWDARYAADGYLFGEQPAAFTVEHAHHLVPGSTALVVGDGEGRNSVYLAQRGVRVTAMDISDVAVAKAADLAKRRGVELDLNVADILTWPWDETRYDAIVAVFIQFVFPPERDLIFDGFRRALRPGGTLLLHGYRLEHLDLDGIGGPPYAECMYTEEMLRDAFADFDVVTTRSYELEVAEGAAHVGRSALIDFVARRSGRQGEVT